MLRSHGNTCKLARRCLLFFDAQEGAFVRVRRTRSTVSNVAGAFLLSEAKRMFVKNSKLERTLSVSWPCTPREWPRLFQVCVCACVCACVRLAVTLSCLQLATLGIVCALQGSLKSVQNSYAKDDLNLSFLHSACRAEPSHVSFVMRLDVLLLGLGNAEAICLPRAAMILSQLRGGRKSSEILQHLAPEQSV